MIQPTTRAQIFGFVAAGLVSGVVSLHVLGALLVGPGASILYALHAFIVPYLVARKANVVGGALLGTLVGCSPPWLLALLALTGPDATTEGLKFGGSYFMLTSAAALVGVWIARRSAASQTR